MARGLIAIRDSFNVASLTDNGRNYTVNFTTALGRNYAAVFWL
jgi:hypothetical protein